ncbi:Wzz/FepE/Etk N-terminal domain-containing protein [Saccharospirillum salsuginis]|uniref:Polysaccharide chain length determinant N-terminal domain-containing protein n=1 Tax=Saccharospirillum salsuginis TaxID=418750 RepID=A0A918KEA1_9GAMM|nr:Wzz/FepE/Etk N-terminal domain-containing protein [Saccharospirillum salsuginis]GGX60494.1 hypothetical protein GCM10007392_30650 [Saccharospirillum salsuginis]
MTSKDTRQDLTSLRPHPDDDTIDLGELLRGIIEQWKLILGITVLGAIIGVAVALLLPRQYRVEAIVTQPNRAAVQPILAQQISPIMLDELTQTFLLNVQSLNLIEQAYTNTGMGENAAGGTQTEEEAFSAIRGVSDSLLVEPVRYEFYELSNEEKTPLNKISVNLLSSQPRKAKAFIDELLSLAEEKTLKDTISDINAVKSIRIQTAESKYEQLLKSAEATLMREQQRVRQALSVAQSLNIDSPTSWEALVHGAGNVQMVNTSATEDDLFLHGTRFLQARLESLNGDGANQLFLEGIEEQVVDEKGNLTVVVTTPSQLQGEIKALQEQNFHINDVQLLDAGATARIPSSAEKPNRPLIAIAATVLAGFLGLFIALVRMAIRKDD